MLPRNSNIPTSTQSSQPLDILLETTKLPATDKTEKRNCAAQTTPDKAEAANSTSRRSKRRRQQTERFQINL
ncbi:unnamed protein product [Trichobilharzia regenti]|nr:unnamed protein product [Trichobilharzia regenti]